jgi:hypothetical protein
MLFGFVYTPAIILDGMYAIGIVVNFSKLAYKLFNDYG